MQIENTPFFSSWSGGKDSCLALYHAIRQGGRPLALLTMMIENGQRSRSHGLPAAVLQAQACALNLPLVRRPAAWENYEAVFISALQQFKAQGIAAGVFGDIDLQEHLQWVERVCATAGLKAFEPLWQRPRNELLDEFIDLGFVARIVAVKDQILSTDFLGRRLDREVVAQLAAAGVDASGERGEYHTVVENGPIFTAPIGLQTGEIITESGYHFIDITLAD